MLNKESWFAYLNQLMQHSNGAYQLALKKVKAEEKHRLVFPEPKQRLRAISVDPQDIEVVITGTRPIGIPSFSDGLAYSSLGEVTKYMRPLHFHYRVLFGQEPPLIKDEWMSMGVCLLNRELTSSSPTGYYPDVNIHRYWTLFTKMVIQRLLNDEKERVFILADEYSPKEGYKNPHKHKVFYDLEQGLTYLSKYKNVFMKGD